MLFYSIIPIIVIVLLTVGYIAFGTRLLAHVHDSYVEPKPIVSERVAYVHVARLPKVRRAVLGTRKPKKALLAKPQAVIDNGRFRLQAFRVQTYHPPKIMLGDYLVYIESFSIDR